MNVMIAGTSGAGKTVLLACLHGLYSQPDADGYFLEPKNKTTYEYLETILSKLRNEKWPEKTGRDENKELWWSLRRKLGGQVLGDIPARDFDGQTYLYAFGGVDTPREEWPRGMEDAVKSLTQRIEDADILLVIVNLQDVVKKGVLSSEDLSKNYAIKELLDFVNNVYEIKPKKVAILLSQSDLYADLIQELGGARAVVTRYLPMVAHIYEDLDVFAVSAVDKVDVNAEGNIIPARDFSSESLRPVMKWIIQRVEEVKREEEDAKKQAVAAEEKQQQEVKAAYARGRIWRWSRCIYWCALFNVLLLQILGSIYFEAVNVFSVIAVILWMWATACRLRDCNCRGWGTLFALLIFIPNLFAIVSVSAVITSVIVGFIPGTNGENRFGK